MTELSKRPNYRADIQGLRGVAVLLVVLFHAGLPVPGGFVGVDVFFVISGYVIAEGIVRALEKGTFSFRDFYVKRMRRLLPALAVMLGAVLALLPFFGPPVAHKVAGRTAVAAALFNANHYLLRGTGYFDASTEYNAFLHTWSLSVEEQFYFGFPLLLFLLWRIGHAATGRRRVFAGIAVASALSCGISLWLSYTSTVGGIRGEDLAFYTVIARTWQFGVGALIALGAAGARQSPLSHPVGGAAGIGMIVCAAFAFDDATVFPGVAVFLPTAGAALVILSGLRREPATIVGRALATRGMARLGDLSYSWYLWHWPLIVFAAATFPHIPLQASIAAAVASLGVAVLNERYLETPIRFRPFEKQLSALVVFGCCMIIPMVVFVLGDSFNEPAKKIDSSQEVSVMQEFVPTPPDGCSGGHYPDSTPEICRFGPPEGKRVHLIGDSNAGHWLPVLGEIVPSLGANLSVSTYLACPFNNLQLRRENKDQTLCNAWVRLAFEQLIADPREVVIIGNSVDGYVDGLDYSFVDQATGEILTTAVEKRMAYYSALTEFVQALNSVGTEVVIIDPVPKFQVFTGESWHEKFRSRRRHAALRRCSYVSRVVEPGNCNFWRDLVVDDDKEGGVIYADLDAIYQMHDDLARGGAHRISVVDKVCPNGRCTALTSDGVYAIYSDTTHIAAYGARMARDNFLQVLRRVINASE